MQSDSPLVIDPIPSPSLNWATYFGGSAAEQGMKTVLDNMGGVFLGGITQSSAGIATAGAFQGTYGGAPFYDAFVAKFDINGNRIWSTYFGGTLDEQLLDILAEPGGNIYFTGSSNSAGLATGGTHQTIIGGGSDAIIVKLSAAGNLIWSTYYGGTSNDSARGLSFLGANIGLTGQTASSNGISSPGAHQLSFGGGGSDGFFTSFTSAGAMNWGSYWGGAGTDVAYQIKTTATFDFVLVATTNSASMATPGAFQTVLGGSNDILVSKFSSAGVQQWATYYGGVLSDNGYGVALDISGDIFITGQTNNSVGFATAGAYDVILNGATDGFVLSLNSSGNRNWSTYIGGTLQDVLQFIWTDGLGNIYVGGNTSSSVGLVTVGATQSVFGGGTYDGVIGSFDISGTVNWITYYGGTGDDFIRSGIGDAISHLYVAGFSASANGIATAGAYQTSLSSTGVLMLSYQIIRWLHRYQLS
ncbi:MAG: SBBP repeat-containing protein [Flavobacteriales bacterium]|nr:SBBP repeat-containing protein [Flavobacteriales bacterium]